MIPVELSAIASAGWPIGASLAVAVVGERLLYSRRRAALNRSLHELRRPLQALSLVSAQLDSPRAGARTAVITRETVDAALAALAELDREVNRLPAEPAPRPVAAAALVHAAVERWRGPAAARDRSLVVRCDVGGALVLADPRRLERALDNLIANALEHGSLNVAVVAASVPRGIRISVGDGGPARARSIATARSAARARAEDRRPHRARARRQVPARSLGSGNRGGSRAAVGSGVDGEQPDAGGMSRRARAIAFGLAALACAGLAAAMASGYRSDLASQLGPLRSVVVASRTLPAHRPLAPEAVRGALEVRRVPARFVPPGALAAPEQALGQAPAAQIPAGAYVLAPQLRPPGSRAAPSGASSVGPGRHPVEIAVAAAGALATGTGDPVGEGVDVIVTTEPRGASATGRTYVAAAGVRLLDLRQSSGSTEAASSGSALSAGGWAATLALTRHQALKLIEAESFAREIRLIGATH